MRSDFDIDILNARHKLESLGNEKGQNFREVAAI
jgi:hypothetical protein